MAKLTKIEIFYIKNNPDNMTAIELSQSLKKPVEPIQKVLDEVAREKEEQAQAEKDKKKGDTYFRQVMGTKTHKKNGKKIAVVMTPTASELADSTRQKGTAKQDHIFRPYND